jgi:hypothetical protein
LNNSILAAALFIYIFVIQYIPMEYGARLAAQLFIGVAGVLLGFYLARLGVGRSLTLFVPIAAYYVVLISTGLDRDYLYFASFGVMVVAVFVATWQMRRK